MAEEGAAGGKDAAVCPKDSGSHGDLGIGEGGIGGGEDGGEIVGETPQGVHVGRGWLGLGLIGGDDASAATAVVVRRAEGRGSCDY